MAPLFAAGRFSIVESVECDDGLALLDRGHAACEISGQCARQLHCLFAQLRLPAFAAGFGKLANCHGLAEFAQGRRLKWRNEPKSLGAEAIAPNAELPADLPLTYQLMNWEQKAVHSGVVLGRAGTAGEVFVLDKLHEGGLNVETYREQVRHWVRMICPLSAVRLRRAAGQQQSLRKAA